MASQGRGSSSSRRTAPARETLYLNPPFGIPEEEAYEAWLTANPKLSIASAIKTLIKAGLGVKIGEHRDSLYCTLDSREAREDGKPCLLSGWSDSVEDCVFLSLWKFQEQLGGTFSDPSPAATTVRRRR